MQHNSVEYLHTLIEAMQLSFADCQWYCADPSHVSVPTQELLDKAYAAERRSLMKPGRCVYNGSKTLNSISVQMLLKADFSILLSI